MSEPMDRRELFSRCGRYLAAAALAAGGLWAARRATWDCRQGCGACPTLSGCRKPQAVASRRAWSAAGKDGGQ